VLKNEDQDRAREQSVRVVQGVCASVLDKLEGAILSLAFSKWEVEEPKGKRRLGAAGSDTCVRLNVYTHTHVYILMYILLHIYAFICIRGGSALPVPIRACVLSIDLLSHIYIYIYIYI
jgi:hypothetical protein